MGVSGGLAVASLIQTREVSRRTRSTAKDVAESSEKKATDAAQATIDADLAAKTEASKKTQKRQADLAAGGRAAQFKTGPLGVTDQANVKKQTLLGA